MLFGLLSSSLLAKVVFGAAALAAVGGVAAAMPSPDIAPAPATTVVQPLANSTSVSNVYSTAEQDLVHEATQFAAEVVAWGECVAEAARAHSGEAFDPEEACGDTPKASDHGLGTESAPGLNKVDGETIPVGQSDQDKVDNPNKPIKSDDGSEASKDKGAKTDDGSHDDD
jgi:hypothetical protein